MSDRHWLHAMIQQHAPPAPNKPLPDMEDFGRLLQVKGLHDTQQQRLARLSVSADDVLKRFVSDCCDHHFLNGPFDEAEGLRRNRRS